MTSDLAEMDTQQKGRAAKNASMFGFVLALTSSALALFWLPMTKWVLPVMSDKWYERGNLLLGMLAIATVVVAHVAYRQVTREAAVNRRQLAFTVVSLVLGYVWLAYLIILPFWEDLPKITR